MLGRAIAGLRTSSGGVRVSVDDSKLQAEAEALREWTLIWLRQGRESCSLNVKEMILLNLRQ